MKMSKYGFDFEGTLVLTEEGHTAIENIQAGDMVWAHNPETGETELKQVVQTFVNETNELVHVFTENDEIICTNEHPFYSPVKGWTAACKLKAGDILVTVNGEYVVVEKVQHEILESLVKVYNFEVEGFHTYYVGSNDGVLVHNSCDKSSAKKIDPNNFEKKYSLDRGTYHRDVKSAILNKVKPNYQVGRNPDILIDKRGNIAYQGANGRGYQDTGLNIINILHELGLQ